MNLDQLQAILDDHKAWLRDEDGKRAYLRGADLRGAYLRGADLRQADLRQADLRGAYLRGADLRQADLRRAYLRGAYLQGADLQGADLQGATLSWQSHDLLAEILRRAAEGCPGRRMIAGLVLISQDWCWADFAKLEHSEKQWALKTLAKYIKPGEEIPELLQTEGKSS